MFLTRTLQLLRPSVVTKCSSLSLHVNHMKAPLPPVASSILNLQPENPWIYRQYEHIEQPKNPWGKINPIRFPNGVMWVPFDDPKPLGNIKAPSVENEVEEKQAARLIVIRRKKMKKHKLRKLRKRVKFEVAKKRQKRELKKEKEFQAVLIKQCKEAEAFSAEKYVEQRLERLRELRYLETVRYQRPTGPE